MSSVYLGLSIRNPFVDILSSGDTIVSLTAIMVMSFQPKLSALGIMRLFLRWFSRMSFMNSSSEKPKKYFDHREVSAWLWRVDVFLIVIHLCSHLFVWNLRSWVDPCSCSSETELLDLGLYIGSSSWRMTIKPNFAFSGSDRCAPCDPTNANKSKWVPGLITVCLVMGYMSSPIKKSFLTFHQPVSHISW